MPRHVITIFVGIGAPSCKHKEHFPEKKFSSWSKVGYLQIQLKATQYRKKFEDLLLSGNESCDLAIMSSIVLITLLWCFYSEGKPKKGGCEPDAGHTVWPLRSVITNKEIYNGIRMASVVRFDSNSVSLSSQHWPFPKHMDHRAARIIYPKHQIVCMKHVTRGQRCSKMWPAKWNQWNQTVVSRLSKVHTFDCCRCIKSK